MKFARLLLCILTVIAVPSGVYSDSSYSKVVAKKAKRENRDRKARRYIYEHEDTYVAVVWPRGISHLKGIRDILSQFAPIVFEKNFSLSNYGPILLYQVCQLGIWPIKAENMMVNNYLSGMTSPYRMHAFIFQTNKSFDQIINIKQKIRDYVGISYWSIHTSDNHFETKKLADVLFVDSLLEYMSTAAWGTSIEFLWNKIVPLS